MGDEDISSAVRNVTVRTKVSTLLRDKPLVVLKQGTTVELALQVGPSYFPHY